MFWVKEKIITLENMRKSRDEELVAQLLAYMVVGEGMNPSKRALDGLYHYEDDEDGLSNKVENGINRIGVDVIINWFDSVYSEILLILHNVKEDFCTLLYGKNHPESLNRVFQVVFLAFFELIVNKKKKIADYNKLIGILLSSISILLSILLAKLLISAIFASAICGFFNPLLIMLDKYFISSKCLIT